MTLYNHFSSKERLVEEVLVQRERRYWSYLDKSVKNSEITPFIMAVKGHCDWLEDYSYKGDMFLRAIEDYSGIDEQIENVARGHKHRLLSYLESIAKTAGMKNGHDLAIRYTILMEGTTSMTTLIGVEEATSHALDVAKLFVNEASTI